MASEVYLTTDKNQSIVRCGDLWICATGPKPMSDESVEEFIAETVRVSNALGWAQGVIQYSPRTSPNAAQRRRFATVPGVKGYRCLALVSDSTMVRGAITAMNWLMPSNMQTRAFSPPQAIEALAWLRENMQFPLDEAKVLLETVKKNVGL